MGRHTAPWWCLVGCYLLTVSRVVAEIAVPSATSCKDMNSRCPSVSHRCDEDSIKTLCQKTCGACPTHRLTATDVSSPAHGNTELTPSHAVPSATSCEDKNSWCPTVLHRCDEDSIKTPCQKTCGACPTHRLTATDVSSPAHGNTELTPSHAVPSAIPCEDKKSWCSTVSHRCDEDSIKTPCQKTCGACPPHRLTPFATDVSSPAHGNTELTPSHAAPGAQVVESTCRVETSSQDWTVSGSCDIFNAPAQAYSCDWRFTTQQWQFENIPVTNVQRRTISSNTSRCSFRQYTPTSSGQYEFSIRVNDGRWASAGRVTIRGPRKPAAKCPQSAMENSSITCSCTATDMGEPAGRLVWQGADNKTLLQGTYGKSPVNYSLTVRNVDNGRRFTCTLEWTNDQSQWKSDDAVLDVLHEPSLVISGYTRGQVLYEGDRHRVTCSAQGGNPLPSQITLTCQDQTAQEDQRGSNKTVSLQFIVKRDNPLCTCSAHAPRHQGWKSVSSRVEFTVYYPPSRPRIQELKNAYKLGDSVRLTCNSEDEGSPPASYQWLENNGITITGSSFTKHNLQRTDNGRKIGCRAVNDFTDVKHRNLRTDRTLVVHYPPSRPSISGYTSDQVLYMGDKRTVTCSAEGGNPAVSKITLTCQNLSTAAYSSYGAKTVTQRLTFNASAGNPWCTCTAHPPTDAKWDAVTSHENLTIYTPPSPPQITRLDRRQFAYRENEVADLTCGSGTVGNPAVSYLWSYQGRNNVSLYGNRLTVWSLTKKDNGLEIGCRARNNFTDTKGLNLTTVFRLEVYYRPQIRFQSLSGSECLDADSGECTVDEGQRIRVECLAHSNPAIKNISWEKAFQTPVLDITASRSQDSSEFTCEAATETNETARLWYPLVNSKSLRIRVQYLPDRPVLTLKSSGLNVTSQSVKENDTVTFVCVGKARPKPSVKLMRDEQLLKSTDPSPGADKDDETRMSHTLQSASCEDSGRYSCVVSNGEVSSTTHAGLFVRCPPRPADSVPLSQLNITYKGTQAQLTLNLVAYPLPNVTVTYDALYADGANTPRLLSQDKFNGTCEETDAIYQARCTIWVQHVVSSDEGSYQLTVQNSEGSLDTLKFQLFVEGPATGASLSSGLSVFIIAGIVFAIAVVVAVVIIVVAVVKQRRRKEGEVRYTHRPPHSTSPGTGEDEVNVIVDSLYGSARDSQAAASGTSVNQPAVYAVVNKKKPQTQYPPASPFKASGQVTAPSGDVYSVVQKKSSAASPQTTGASATSGDVYANVNKKESAGAQFVVQESSNGAQANGGDVYAVVSKPKPNPKTTDAETEAKARDKPAVMTKPKRKSPVTNSGEMQQGAGNGGGAEKAARTSGTSDKQVNPDGLLYTSVDFSNYKPDPDRPLPVKISTEYASVIFQKTAPPKTSSES